MGSSVSFTLIHAVLLVVLGLALPATGFGQGATGAINGTVTDPSGAAVPGAKVVLRNVATTTEQSVVTNEVGRYHFPVVNPGNYTITVTKDGFATAIDSEFTLLVNQASTHDITLKVGSITEDVTVTAELFLTPCPRPATWDAMDSSVAARVGVPYRTPMTWRQTGGRRVMTFPTT